MTSVCSCVRSRITCQLIEGSESSNQSTTAMLRSSATAVDHPSLQCRWVIACNHERGTRQCPAGGDDMGKVISGITTSLDGYVTGPNDGPERGLGEGGERLHYWVFGGPWSYAEEPRGEAGGADTIRQALRAGYVEEFTLTIAPVVLGGGKRLFEGFDEDLDLEHVRVLQSPFATHITYRVKGSQR